MEDKKKSERLEKEITELEKKKQQKDKVSQLFKQRNQLKFLKLFAFGKGLKKIGGKVGKWADEKSKQMEEDMNKKEKESPSDKPEKKVDLIDELLGETETYKKIMGEE